MRNSSLKRVVAMLLAIVMCMGLFAGCGNAETTAPAATEGNNAATPAVPAATPEDPDEEIVLTLGTSVAWNAVHAYLDSVVMSHTLVGFMYDRIIQPYGDGTFAPRGADSWDISEDGHTVTFYLNKNAKWTDGTPVTAYDYEFAAQVCTTPGNTAYRASTYSCLTGTANGTGALEGELGVEVIDDYTIKYTFKDPVVPVIDFLGNISNFIPLPKHILKDEDPALYKDWEFWKNPVTNGPLILESEVAGSELVYVANKDYHLGAPKFDKLKVVMMDASSQIPAMLNGDIDIAYPAPAHEDLELLRGQDGITVYDVEYPTMMRTIMINENFFPDVRLRRALDMAVDREAICAALGNVTLMHTGIADDSIYYNENITASYDPEGAKKLIDEMVADGSLDLSQPLPPLNVMAGWGQVAANILQQNWSELGLIIEQQPVESTALAVGMRNNEIAWGTMNRMLCADPTKDCFNKGSGVTKFSSDVWQNIKRDFIYAENDEVRKEIIYDMQELWQEQVPHIPMGAAYENYAYSNRVHDGGSLGMELAQFGAWTVWEWNSSN